MYIQLGPLGISTPVSCGCEDSVPSLAQPFSGVDFGDVREYSGFENSR